MNGAGILAVPAASGVMTLLRQSLADSRQPGSVGERSVGISRHGGGRRRSEVVRFSSGNSSRFGGLSRVVEDGGGRGIGTRKLKLLGFGGGGGACFGSLRAQSSGSLLPLDCSSCLRSTANGTNWNKIRCLLSLNCSNSLRAAANGENRSVTSGLLSLDSFNSTRGTAKGENRSKISGLLSLDCSSSSRGTAKGQNRCRISGLLGRRSRRSNDNSSSSSSRRRIHKQGRLYSRGGEHEGLINARTVKVGLIHKLVQFGRGGGLDGGGGNGRGWGGDGGGGGEGGEGLNYPNSDEGGFNFFSGLIRLMRDRCKSGLWIWALCAFVTGFLVSSLDMSDYAHARAFSKPRTLLPDGGDGGDRREAENGVELSGRKEEEESGLAGRAVWEVRGSQWRRFTVDLQKDEFVFDVVKPSEEEALKYERDIGNEEGRSKDVVDKRNASWIWPGNGKSSEETLREAGVWARELVKQVFLPAGFPGSVTEGYLEFSSWRMAQMIASQVSGVLTTQALLYAVGLGKGAIPAAAAVNWVVRDGIGYLSKIMLAKYGRHFDVHPKGWRLVSDMIENASYALELLTPIFPHLFVYLAAAAGAGRSAAGMIQAATKSCIIANFAAQHNFAEIIAKGEAQGMASKSVGIGLGILIAGYVGSQGPLLAATFVGTSALHIFFNLKSYQAVHLRTLNPYRASLVLAEYLKTGIIPTIKDVNAEEPIFFGVAWFNPKPRRDQGKLDTVSPESKRVASAFEKKLELGVSLVGLVQTRGEADALIDLYSRDKYLLAVKEDCIKVVLKEGASPRDMLKAMVQAVYFLNFSNGGPTDAGNIVSDCSRGGILQVTHDLVEEKFESITQALSGAGWVSDGVLARSAPNRLLLENQSLLSSVGDKA